MAKKKQENKTKSKTRKPLLSGRFKFTIGFKMITIISLIIASALFGITFLATYFFKEDYELRIKENSHEVAHAIALKVRSDFNAIVSQADYLASILEDKQSGDHEKTTLKEHVFGEDSSIVFVALVSRSGDVFSTDIHASHKKFLEQNSLSDDDFFNAIKNEKSSLMNVFNGDTIVNNASLFFKIPIISIGIPYRYSAPSKASTILVIYVPMTPFLESVKSTGITKSMIVNGFGDVLAHHDSSLVRAKTNFVNLPIVAAMLKSKADNGLLRYADSDGSYYLGAYYKTGFGDTGIISTAPESKAFEALYRIRWRNILITLIVLNAGILIVYFFSKTLTRPIKRLVSATQEIEKGNFHVDIKRTSSDEVGDLTDSFVKMGIGLGERERIKDAFGKFVNKELADKVLRGELKLGGERITAPVFFSDIRYFTAISEKMDPEEVVDFLNEYMTRMVDCVNRTGGVVDKFIGDAIMAIWGTPVSSGNDTESAVNCALMMRETLMEYNAGRGTAKKPIIQIGCGINTGPVIAGQIGSHERMEYTVIGDTVNVASRIESLNKPFGTDILISQDSYRLVEGIYNTVAMQKIMIKGKSKPQQIYAILGRKDDPRAPKTIAALRKMLGIKAPTLKNFDPNQKEEKYEIIED
ncbi:MAG TPA: adenylate/guanylate cyclase domain-containing protein [Spirochaetota bacterium]|nr:adenylate/guanylate cyclase domain-containing protein [Spirochaetota bacterium]HPV43174.1 adenylate/guanylate cyclase domain-containing protein [Spirochaetota bacterium]